MGKTLKRNRTNLKKLESMVKHINGYLQINQYRSLLLEITVQDGVIQVIRTTEIDKRKTMKL